MRVMQAVYQGPVGLRVFPMMKALRSPRPRFREIPVVPGEEVKVVLPRGVMALPVQNIEYAEAELRERCQGIEA